MYNPSVRRKSYLKARDKNLAYSREYNLKRKFSLSAADYEEMLKSQGGVCAICNKTCSRSLAVDHCHSTGIIRGLLCYKCNMGIGYLKDDPAVLQAAINYLTKERQHANIQAEGR